MRTVLLTDAPLACHGFGMRVLGHQRRLERLPPETDGATLQELLSHSDFVVLACPLTPQTRYLINRATISAMKASAWLTNECT